ncbi:MAG: FMN reductase [Candidatus Tokpelaia hoelldobleri]|uniref:FMN reductase n=1 Tax=Candidatus Tokpelaia hoelldobleri TaxID=1902579 RepID=A0A1U9JT35_9HYPH|nr:MAG: FMN reductase [Candidatus Tokpelaia hoelldoblerii]
MTRKKLVGLAGSYSQPSRTAALVAYIRDVAEKHYAVESTLYTMQDLGASLGAAQHYDRLAPQARRIFKDIAEADALIIAIPVYKGSYPGLFKHMFDLMDPDALVGKPVILAASGGGSRHALVVEHQLRPLFGFFRAHGMATTIYASAADFAGEGTIVADGLVKRVAEAVGQLAPFFQETASFVPLPETAREMIATPALAAV